MHLKIKKNSKTNYRKFDEVNKIKLNKLHKIEKKDLFITDIYE